MTMNDTCKTCRFADKRAQPWQCKRYPPQGVPGMVPGSSTTYMTVEWHYPPVTSDDGCGEYNSEMPRLLRGEAYHG